MVSPMRITTNRENLLGRANFNHPAAIKDKNLLLPKQPSTPLGDAGNRLNVVRQIFAKDSGNTGKNEGFNLKPLPKPSIKATAEPALPPADEDIDSVWSGPLAYSEFEDDYHDIIPPSLFPTRADISNLVYANPGPRKYYDEDPIIELINESKDIWMSLREKEFLHLAELVMDADYDVPDVSPPLEMDFSLD